MATQKQRRRRAKEKRHDYDLVEIDEEGNEIVLTGTELRDPPERVKAKSKGDAGKGRKAPSGRGAGRTVEPPSWRRVGKRAAIFAPLFFVTVMLLSGGKLTVVAALFQTLMLVAVFVPFSYVMDRFVYRSQQKRLAKTGR